MSLEWSPAFRLFPSKERNKPDDGVRPVGTDCEISVRYFLAALAFADLAGFVAAVFFAAGFFAAAISVAP